MSGYNSAYQDNNIPILVVLALFVYFYFPPAVRLSCCRQCAKFNFLLFSFEWLVSCEAISFGTMKQRAVHPNGRCVQVKSSVRATVPFRDVPNVNQSINYLIKNVDSFWYLKQSLEKAEKILSNAVILREKIDMLSLWHRVC